MLTYFVVLSVEDRALEHFTQYLVAFVGMDISINGASSPVLFLPRTFLDGASDSVGVSAVSDRSLIPRT